MILKSGLEVIEIGAIRKLECGSYSPFIVTMAVYVTVCEMFSVKEWRDLETGGRSVKVIKNGAVR